MTIRQTAILTDIVGFDVIGVPQQAIEGIPYDNGYRKKKPGRNPLVRFGFHDIRCLLSRSICSGELSECHRQGGVMMATPPRALRDTQPPNPVRGLVV